jgi:5-methylcytosine-specific restriction endonuclease McrA
MSASHQRCQGNNRDRAARKHWMLRNPAFGGNGATVPCSYCPRVLDYASVTADRIIPGSQGGTYKRSNIRPACLPCNSSRKDNPHWTPASR